MAASSSSIVVAADDYVGVDDDGDVAVDDHVGVGVGVAAVAAVAAGDIAVAAMVRTRLLGLTLSRYAQDRRKLCKSETTWNDAV